MTQIQIPDKVYADITKACDVIGQSGQGAEELGYALDRLTAAVMGETTPAPSAAPTEQEAFAMWWPTVDQTIGEAAAREAWHTLYPSLREYLDKTDWVRQTLQTRELGMHRADVLKQRIEMLEYEKRRAQEALDDAKDQVTQLHSLLDGLRNLCGYVEDGSSTLVRISQDDATKDWIVSIGMTPGANKAYGSTFGSAIKSAIEKFGGDHD